MARPTRINAIKAFKRTTRIKINNRRIPRVITTNGIRKNKKVNRICTHTYLLFTKNKDP
jgi:hypothetical protein